MRQLSGLGFYLPHRGALGEQQFGSPAPGLTLMVGALDAEVTVNVQGAPGKIDAWIDFNGDGSWAGPGEQVFASQDVVVGDNNLTFDVPSAAVAGETYARFRLSTEGGLGIKHAASGASIVEATTATMTFASSTYDSDAAAMDATLGIDDSFVIEDFEDLNLAPGLSVSIADAEPFTTLPRLLHTSTGSGTIHWDGSHVLAGHTGNPDSWGVGETTEFHFANGASIAGFGLSAFQGIPTHPYEHEVFVNGTSIGLLDTVPNMDVSAVNRSVRSGYLFIEAPLGEVINSIRFTTSSPNDGFTFDHVAFAEAANRQPVAAPDGEVEDYRVTIVEDGAPQAIELDDNEVAENLPGATIGNLSVVDPDEDDSHVLVVSDGRFEVVDSQLKLKPGVSLDYESEPEIELEITATDSAGESLTQTFTIAVQDIDLIESQVVIVRTPTENDRDLAELPESIDTVPLGGTYYAEVYVRAEDLLDAGITGGLVDVHYNTEVVDGTNVVHTNYDLNLSNRVPRGVLQEAAGLVQNLGGDSTEITLGADAAWVRLGYVEMVATELGEATFELSPGDSD